LTIEIISTNTVKITLSEGDMLDYDINYERLDRKNPETKRLLIELLEAVRDEKNIDLCSEKLYVEAFPQNNGGCLLYISILNDRLKPKVELYSELICEISDLNNLLPLCSRIFKGFSHIIRTSELYFDGKIYRLIINTLPKTDKKICNLLNEYGNLIGKGEIIGASTREHFDTIIEKDAIEKLSTLC